MGEVFILRFSIGLGGRRIALSSWAGNHSLARKWIMKITDRDNFDTFKAYLIQTSQPHIRELHASSTQASTKVSGFPF